MRIFIIILLLSITMQSFAQFGNEYLPQETPQSELNLKSGEYLIKASKSFNAAALMPLLGSGIVLIGSTQEDIKTYAIAGSVVSAFGLIFWFRGTNFLRLAGEKYNQDQKKTELGFTQTDQGITLALKF